MTTTSPRDKELRDRLLEIFSANFNDGEPIVERLKSKDAYSTSVIYEFIDEFVVPFIHAHDATRERGIADILATTDFIYELMNAPTNGAGVAMMKERIATLTNQLPNDVKEEG